MDDQKLETMQLLNDKIEQHAIMKQALDEVYQDEEYLFLQKELEKKEQKLAEDCEPFKTSMKLLEQEIKEMVLGNLQETYDHMNMQVKFKKGYSRKSWDSKKLNEAIGEYPALEQFRKITEIEPSVSITTRTIATVENID